MQIEFQDVNYIYQSNLPTARKVLRNINLNILPGTFTAIIGKTGSGKSTLLQHFNGLLIPTSGYVRIDDIYLETSKKSKRLYELRSKVGIVFQFPEHQLFEETVEADIAFGPLNYGASKEECSAIVRDVIKKVGLDENFLSLSPFELSGGQKRRVAIATILAMKPKVLVLDEPTVGLDSRGCTEIMELIYRYFKEEGCTIVVVTHNMEEVITYAERIVILDEGKISMDGLPQNVLIDHAKLTSLGLELPKVALLQKQFEDASGHKFAKRYFYKDEFVEALQALLLTN